MEKCGCRHVVVVGVYAMAGIRLWEALTGVDWGPMVKQACVEGADGVGVWCTEWHGVHCI
jgi:hypothetical protein